MEEVEYRMIIQQVVVDCLDIYLRWTTKYTKDQSGNQTVKWNDQKGSVIFSWRDASTLSLFSWRDATISSSSCDRRCAMTFELHEAL